MPRFVRHLLFVVVALAVFGSPLFRTTGPVPVADDRQGVGADARASFQRHRADGRALTDGQRGPAPAPQPSRTAPKPSFEPNEVLVANAPPDFRTRSGALGYRVVETLLLHHLGIRVYRVRLPPGDDVPAAISRLRARFPGVRIDANHHYDRSVGLELTASHARAAIGWDDLPADCGRGVRLGMIDAGIDTTHPAFDDADLKYAAFNREGRQPGPADHGTAIAALLVGVLKDGKGWGGLLPGATLYAGNIFEITEAGRSVATARGLLAAMDWMVGKRVHALNLSIAGPDNKVVRRAVDQAGRGGLVVVAAAGNWGSDSRPAYPAAYDDVIAVTAIGADRTVYAHANQGRWVDFAAPGVRLWTAVPTGGKYQSGTSFASPFVSVLAGVAVAGGAPGDGEQIREALRRDVVDLGVPGRDPVFGWGMVTAPPRCRPNASRTSSLAEPARGDL